MRPRPFLLLIAGVVLALMAAGEASAARYDISGFVMTDETGLSGATVSTFNTVTGAVAVTTALAVDEVAIEIRRAVVGERYVNLG